MVLFGQKMNPMSKQYPKKGIVPLLSFVKLTNENIKNSVKAMHTYYRNSELEYSIVKLNTCN